MSLEKCRDLSIQIHDLMMDIVGVDSDLISKLISRVHIFQKIELEKDIEERIKLIEKLIKLKDKLNIEVRKENNQRRKK